MQLTPDGQVSVCEEMYWHQAFLLGDVKKNTIKEIWNSEKALKLWNISQEDIPEDSKCHTCQEFNKCRRGLGVCWKMAMQAYGLDKYYYPDPRCPRATTPVHPFCFD
ncbi:SPASM domain-containing protein [Hallella absiana]|uniref:SPASM domain-containing protein n=1 Tax=Hallella absiana TaxID=2925336 RepID=UPI0021CA37C2|nr:SPASM domain-containing protein [Hallella absiana]